MSLWPFEVGTMRLEIFLIGSVPHSFSYVPCFKYLQSLFLQAQEDATNVKCSVTVVFIVSNTRNFFQLAIIWAFLVLGDVFSQCGSTTVLTYCMFPEKILNLQKYKLNTCLDRGFFIIYCLVYMHLPLQIQNLWLPSENTLEIECETIHVIMI